MAKVKELHRRWSKDPEYGAAYDALDEEFELAKLGTPLRKWATRRAVHSSWF